MLIGDYKSMMKRFAIVTTFLAVERAGEERAGEERAPVGTQCSGIMN
jgi:hypothetical protein